MSGVIGYCQPSCWLIGVELLTKPGCGQSCCIGTPTCVDNVFGTIGCKEVVSSSFINNFSLSSTKGQSLKSCATCWQYAHNDAISTTGCMLGTSRLHWTCDRSIIPITCTFGQTF